MNVPLKTLLTVCLLSITGTALAATYNVPADYTTIQSAIDSCANGDEIIVAPGTYHEQLSVNDKSIVIKSSGGADQTIIDGDGSGVALTVTAPQGVYADRNLTVEGFTIKNGTRGIRASGSYTVTVNNSIITNNQGGVYLYTDRYAGDYLTFNLNGSTISNNTTATNGGGIYGYYHAQAYIKNSSIINNSAGYSGGAIYLEMYCSAEIENSVLTGNSAGIHGGGVYSNTYGYVQGINTIFAKNTAAGNGGAMYLIDGTTASLTNSTITDNSGVLGRSIMTSSGPQFGAAKIYASNTILWSGDAYGARPYFVDESKVFFDHSIVQYGSVTYPGEGNLPPATYVSFVDRVNGDYRLQYWSAGVDGGKASSQVLTDILGVPRPRGEGYDMGAYEFNDTTLPVTTAFDYTTDRYFGSGWYWLGAIFSLTVTDDVGIKELHYTVNGVETVIPVSTPGSLVKTYTVPSIALYAEGENTFSYYAVDMYGNAETPTVKTFNVAALRPTVSSSVSGTVVMDWLQPYYTSNATVTISGDDRYGIREIHYAVNGGNEVVVPGASATFTLTADGTYSISNPHCISNTGIPSGNPAPLYIVIDKTAPANSLIVSGTTTPTGWYTSDVTVEITAIDANYVSEIHYTLDGVTTVVPGHAPNLSTTLTIPTDGTHTLSVYSIDVAGNVSSTTTRTIQIDRTAPFVVATSPANNATGVPLSSSITITLDEAVTAGNAYGGIVLKKGSTTVSATKSLSGNQLTIQPASALSKNTTYTVTVPADSLVNGAGFGTQAGTTVTFKTGSH